MNRKKNFDATEELQDLTKNNGSTTSGNKKKRARTFFGAGTKSAEKYNSGYGKDLELNQDFFLDDNVACRKKVIISKKRSRNAEVGKKLQPNKS